MLATLLQTKKDHLFHYFTYQKCLFTFQVTSFQLCWWQRSKLQQNAQKNSKFHTTDLVAGLLTITPTANFCYSSDFTIMVAFSLPAKIRGEGVTIHTLPALFIF